MSVYTGILGGIILFGLVSRILDSFKEQDETNVLGSKYR